MGGSIFRALDRRGRNGSGLDRVGIDAAACKFSKWALMRNTLDLSRSTLVRLWFGNGHAVASRRTQSRSSKQYGLLQVLATAHHQKLNPAILVAGLAEEYRGRHRRKLGRLAERMMADIPVAAAIEQTPGLLPESTVLTLQFASQTGTLSQAYQILIRQHDERSQMPPSHARASSSVGYCIATSIALVLVTVFILTFIAPMMEHMCSEFSIEMPWALRQFIDVGGWLSDYWWFVLLLILCAWVWLRTPMSRRFWRTVPGLRWLHPTDSVRSAELLRLLSLSTAAGRPMTCGTLCAGTLPLRPTDSSQLASRTQRSRARRRMCGRAWPMRTCSRTSESKGFAALTDARSRAWAMRQLAELKVEQVSWRGHTFYTLLHPALVIAFAVARWRGSVSQ